MKFEEDQQKNTQAKCVQDTKENSTYTSQKQMIGRFNVAPSITKGVFLRCLFFGVPPIYDAFCLYSQFTDLCLS